jgi:hypothetical protein
MLNLRFPFPGAAPVFVGLSALEALLLFAPSQGIAVPLWPEASAIGLFVLAALAWFTVPDTAKAKKP